MKGLAMSYHDWPERKLSVNSLRLDSLNPRIPTIDQGLDQRDLIADLVMSDKVYELAKNFVENGYYPVESLIVIKDNLNRFVVIEGNRRLAALKLLLKPEKAPKEDVPKFRALSNRIDVDTIRKVKVIIAPSREEAVPIIISKHTQVQIREWSPITKGRYYQNLLNKGFSISDLSSEYNILTSEIIRALRLYQFYLLACSLELPEEIAEIVQDPRKFEITTLERLYGSKDVKNFLGISFEQDEIIGHIEEKEFRKAFTKIVTDIATGKIKARDIYHNQDRIAYLESIQEIKPDPNKTGHFSTKEMFPPSKGEGQEVKQSLDTGAKRKPSRRKKKLIGLIPAHIVCDVNNQRINYIFEELQRIEVAKFANATAILFRVFLETSLSHYLDRTGHLELLIQDVKIKRGKNLPSDWHPTLPQMLKYLVQDDVGLIKNGNLLKVLNKFISQNDKLFSVDTLNLFVHNEYFIPTEDKLRDFWYQLEGLFQIILIESDSE